MSRGQQKPIRWLVAAVQDLAQIVDTIAQDSPQAAEQFAEKLLARVEILEHFTHLGTICPHYRRARQLIHGSYLIYYTVHRKEIVVRAVVHGARLFRSQWLRRED
jgi:plasmid stabilization system protein ParE